MQFIDQAIIINTTKYSENSGIITAFCKQNGLFKGLARGITSKKNRGIYQTGNRVMLQWWGRLPEQLGSITCELEENMSFPILDNYEKLNALRAFCSLLYKTLAERDPHQKLYNYFANFLLYLKHHNNWQAEYIKLEIILLEELGFGLDLSKCAATGQTNDLYYVSPKSGRAISQNAGKAYHNKLLLLPQFLLNETKEALDAYQMNNALALCEFFLNKYVLFPHNRKLPHARIRLAQFYQDLIITINQKTGEFA